MNDLVELKWMPKLTYGLSTILFFCIVLSGFVWMNFLPHRSHEQWGAMGWVQENEIYGWPYDCYNLAVKRVRDELTAVGTTYNEAFPIWNIQNALLNGLISFTGATFCAVIFEFALRKSKKVTL